MLATLLLPNPLLVPPTACRAIPKLGPGFFDRYSQGSLGLPIRRSVGQQDTLDGICIQPGDELHRELPPAAGPFSYVLKRPGVRVLRISVDLSSISQLHDAAQVHDGEAITN